MKKEIEKSMIIVGYFNTSLLEVCRNSTKNVSKDFKELDSITNQ